MSMVRIEGYFVDELKDEIPEGDHLTELDVRTETFKDAYILNLKKGNKLLLHLDWDSKGSDELRLIGEIAEEYIGDSKYNDYLAIFNVPTGDGESIVKAKYSQNDYVGAYNFLKKISEGKPGDRLFEFQKSGDDLSVTELRSERIQAQEVLGVKHYNAPEGREKTMKYFAVRKDSQVAFRDADTLLKEFPTRAIRGAGEFKKISQGDTFDFKDGVYSVSSMGDELLIQKYKTTQGRESTADFVVGSPL